MTENIEQIYKVIDIIIKAQMKARKANDYNSILLNCEALLEYMPSLINYSVGQESEYRKFEATLADTIPLGETKRNSSAYCETQAKATDHYKNWQQSRNFIELLYEMVQMGKKLAGSIDKEFNSQ